MKITDLLPDAKQWEALQGVEKDLVHNRRTSRTGAIIAIAAIIVQAIAAIQGPYLANLGQFLANLISGNWDQLFGEGGLDLYEAIGLSVVVAGVLIYAGYGWISFFFKESEEPFRYTFWIDKIELLNGTGQTGDDSEDSPFKGIDRIDLLHHDVKERV